jgi:hypothetical protein
MLFFLAFHFSLSLTPNCRNWSPNYSVLVLLIETSKPPESARQQQTHAKLVKSARNFARNWESARIIFCPSDHFQIRQNFSDLAEKTAIWQRWQATKD